MQGAWERIAAKRMTRRRALQAGGAALVTGALVACRDSGTSSVPTPTSQGPDGADVINPAWPPKYGGRLASANAANFGTFDPHLGIAVASAYFPRVYNVLLNQSATRPEFLYLDLAESYEIPDDNTFIFRIRPGVRIGPNDLQVPERDLDGDDVRVTLQRIKAETAAQNNSFARDHVAQVTVDGSNVTVRTPAPYAWFLNRIGLFLNAIAPRELMTGDTSRLTTKAAGGGAFRLRDVTEGEQARFDRNPSYYRRDPSNGDAQLPYADGLDVRVIFDKATQRTAFESGQIQTFMTGSGEEARSLTDAVISRTPNFAYISFTMNPKREPFGDPRVRRAFSRAIDRRRYVDFVYGGDAEPDGLVQWSLGSYALPAAELESTYQPYDPAEARALVDAVGGIRVRMMYPTSTPILEHDQHLPIFLEQMRAAGIEIDQDPQDFGSWVTNYQTLNYQCSLALNQMYETPELPLAFHTERGPFGDGSYINGIGDPEIEAAIKKASTTLDTQQRIDAVLEAQRVIYSRDPMMLPLVTPYLYLAYRQNVKNIPSGIGTSAYLVSTFWLDS